MKIIDGKKISKFMSLILRHKPDVVGLELDKNGWVDIKDLVYSINKYYGTETISLGSINKIVSSDNKNRYEIDLDGKRIRARQGHSVDVDLSLNEKIPPEILYHGTCIRFLDSILKNGIDKRSRQYVHLSENVATATIVGKRHGAPSVLSIRSGDMYRNGFKFYKSTNNVWLTDHVSKDYVSVENENNHLT